jgi:hypothetical protein
MGDSRAILNALLDKATFRIEERVRRTEMADREPMGTASLIGAETE